MTTNDSKFTHLTCFQCQSSFKRYKSYFAYRTRDLDKNFCTNVCFNLYRKSIAKGPIKHNENRGDKVHLTCSQCGGDVYRWKCTIRNTNFCSGLCRDEFRRGKLKKSRNPEDVEREFWSLVDKDHHSGCWVWKGTTNGSGYGKFFKVSHLKKDKRVQAHRMSYELIRGVSLSSSVFLCHTCDNRLCVNPQHLYEGDATSNNRDMYSRSRYRNAKTNADLVYKIRFLEPPSKSHAQIAREYGLMSKTVSGIRSGKTWNWITRDYKPHK